MENMEINNNLFNNIYKGKKVLVTGNTGFKGSWLSIWLLSMGAKVFGISNGMVSEQNMFEDLSIGGKIDYREIDIRNLDPLRAAFDSIKPDFVFHLAAQAIVSESYVNPIDTITTNVVGTANVLEAIRLGNYPCSVIMITSDKCYDNVEWTWGYRESDALGGKDPYSASKGGAELMIKTYYHSFFSKPTSQVKLTTVRAGNVIGGGDWAENRIVPDCIRAWSKKNAVEIRNPHATRPWQHVLEPLSGYLRAGQILYENGKGVNGEPFNFGPNADQNFTVLELLKEIGLNWSFDDNLEHFNINQNSTFHEAGLLKLNCDKALHFLQWKPVMNFEQTSKFTADWYNAHCHSKETNMFDFTSKQILEYEELAKAKNFAWIK